MQENKPQTFSRLAVLEDEIKQLKRTTAISILEIGDRLLEAKSIVPYGEWEKWLSENVRLSNRTARHFMKAARIYKGEERQALADLEITKLYYLSELSDEKRHELIEAADVRGMTTRELKKAVKGTDLIAQLETMIINDLSELCEEVFLKLDDPVPVAMVLAIHCPFWLRQGIQEYFRKVKTIIQERRALAGGDAP